jgi:hypothetical protein
MAWQKPRNFDLHVLVVAHTPPSDRNCAGRTRWTPAPGMSRRVARNEKHRRVLIEPSGRANVRTLLFVVVIVRLSPVPSFASRALYLEPHARTVN